MKNALKIRKKNISVLTFLKVVITQKEKKRIRKLMILSLNCDWHMSICKLIFFLQIPWLIVRLFKLCMLR